MRHHGLEHVEWGFNGECTVVPIDYFLKARVDMHSGGEFLRRLQWFLEEHEAGRVVLASVNGVSRSGIRVGLDGPASITSPLGRCVDTEDRWQVTLQKSGRPKYRVLS